MASRAGSAQLRPPVRNLPRRVRVFRSDPRETRRPARTPEEKALVVLDLVAPVTVAIVKKRYKQLVKQYHPDANGGDKAAEERFKEISAAYRTVMVSLTAE